MITRCSFLLLALGLCLFSPQTHADDVLGYSLLKGQFLLQSGPDAVAPDPDFAFSFIASVELADFDLLTDARVRLPNGTSKILDDLGYSWDILSVYTSWARLNSAYGWGTYSMIFKTASGSNYTCALVFTNTALPPIPRLTNFEQLQNLNASEPITLEWSYSAAPLQDDFVQVYINSGHNIVFSTPEFGEPGALNGTSRSVTIPADTFSPGMGYSLNLEVTRVVDTNTESYPGVAGSCGVFSSTAIDFNTVLPPLLEILPGITNNTLAIQVYSVPGERLILQRSTQLPEWSDFATNNATSGLDYFMVPLGTTANFFRVRQE